MTSKPSRRDVQKVVDFVISEAIRFRDEIKDAKTYVETVAAEGWDYSLYLPDGGSIFIGKSAHLSILDLSKAIVSSDSRLSQRMNPTKFSAILSDRIGKWLVDDSEIDALDFIEACIKGAVESHIEAMAFYIPCIAPYFDGIAKFKIGPVTFIDKKKFFLTHQERLYIQSQSRFEGFNTRYRIHNWIAKVEISNFDQEHAEQRAYLIVRLAIAAIKIKLEHRRAKWCGSDGRTIQSSTRYILTAHQNCEPKDQGIFLNTNIDLILNGNNDEVAHVLSASSRDWFRLFGSFLDHIHNEVSLGHLESRIVNALVWLDVGNSALSDAENIIAFSNSLEAMFVTNDRQRKRQVITRAGKLLGRAGWHSHANGRVDEFYSKRGELVHGEISPLDSTLAEYCLLGKYFTDACLEGFVYFAHWLRQKHVKLGTPQHNLPFNGSGSLHRDFDKELDAFIEEIHQQDLADTFAKSQR